MAKQRTVIFQEPKLITIEETPVPFPGPGEVLVQAQKSAISTGTEMLFFRGQVPEDMPVDATIEALGGRFSYPLAYGYALVGVVTSVGSQVDPSWLGERVFLFAPHQSHVVCRPVDLIPVPDDLSADNAVLMPFMETAVSFLMDSRPMIGERVIVFGQGVIGLLVTALLAKYPLAGLVTVDPVASRREWSLRLGADAALDPRAPEYQQQLEAVLAGSDAYHGADLAYELTGRPEVLDQVVASMGFDGRILVGSWYGRKTAPINLGGHFHRNQIQILSSQVSHIAPRWRGRFSKERRLHLTWHMVAKHQPQVLISHHFPLIEASDAYHLLHTAPETALQVVLDYEGAGS